MENVIYESQASSSYNNGRGGNFSWWCCGCSSAMGTRHWTLFGVVDNCIPYLLPPMPADGCPPFFNSLRMASSDESEKLLLLSSSSSSFFSIGRWWIFDSLMVSCVEGERAGGKGGEHAFDATKFLLFTTDDVVVVLSSPEIWIVSTWRNEKMGKLIQWNQRQFKCY